MAIDKIDYISCSDECGAKTERETIEGSGWQYLQITNRYRCVDCWRALNTVNAEEELKKP